MARYKNYDYSQKVFVPVCLEDQWAPGTLEFAIHTLVETRMDQSVFRQSRAISLNQPNKAAIESCAIFHLILCYYGYRNRRGVQKISR